MSDISGLPLNWHLCMSNSKSCPYYLDATTFPYRSQWEPPPETDTEKLNTLLGDKEKLDKYLEENKPPPPPKNKPSAPKNKKIRCAHLLVKHEGSRRPSSWREPKITRTKSEAFSLISEYKESIRNGASLRKLAHQISDCSSAREEGDLGYFGPGMMQAPFENAAYALKVGEISDIVETESGLHLIERLE